MIDNILAKFDGAFAKNTIRAYRSDFIQYQTWCSQNKLKPIPATADTMAAYVDHLSNISKSATIRRRINSLGTVLKLSKHHDPTNQPEVIFGHQTNAQKNWTRPAASHSSHQTTTQQAT